jgi:type I restriction enzyme S subunit
MAKQLYDYWFVQFDFPDENGRPYKSSGGKMVWNEKLKREIPESWNLCKLSDLIPVKDGTHDSPKQKPSGKFLITSKHLLSSGIDFANAYYISDEDFNAINKRSKVDTNDILFSMIGTIGNKYLVTEENINFAIKNMALIKTTERSDILYYIFCYLSSVDYQHYQHNAISGSIQKFLSLDAMRNIPVLYNIELAKRYNEKVKNLFIDIAYNKHTNLLLTKQRDELLPLLMNGQISVTQPAVNCDL